MPWMPPWEKKQRRKPLSAADAAEFLNGVTRAKLETFPAI
jgi:hypothetical protein